MHERKLFGTDGIRGVANGRHPMTPELALQLGRAVTFVAGRGKKHVPRVAHRQGHAPLRLHARAGDREQVCAHGRPRHALRAAAHAVAIAHLTVSMRADAGIVISASHNPYQDNGIKVFGDDGFQALPDEAESEIESFLADERLLGRRSTGPGIGRATQHR